MLANSSKRLQLTLNATKEREKVILDYLSQSFNPNTTIKEILYNFIIAQSEPVSLKVTQNEVKKSNSKRVKVTQNNSKLLKNKITQSYSKKLNNTQSDLGIVKATQSDDVLLNLDNINDEVLVSRTIVEDPVKKNELEQLQEFVR